MATSHASKEDLSVETMGDYQGRMAELPDGYTANFESIPAGMGGPELFKGLPDDACQSPHWGYLFKGRFKATYTDGSEDVVAAGEAYYLRPGHVYEALEDVESIEFSPTAEWQKTMEQVSKNAESIQQADQAVEGARLREQKSALACRKYESRQAGAKRDTEQAMSRANVEIVHRCFGFWANRDFSAIPEVAHPDFVLDVSQRVFNPAVYHGLDGFRRFVEEVDEMWENFQFEPEEFIDAGDRVFTSARVSGRGRGSGVEAEMREFAVWTFREGKVSRIDSGYRDRDEALEAAGLRAQTLVKKSGLRSGNRKGGQSQAP